MENEPIDAYIALGANLGDRERNIHLALDKLRETPGIEVASVSALLENPAVGGPEDSPAFLNAAAHLRTTLDAQSLLNRLLEIEKDLGRERRERWEPRPIDLDVILFGDQVIGQDHLTIPHPRMHERRFVLAPLSEIAPDVRHPSLGKSIRELLNHLDAAPESEASPDPGLEMEPEAEPEKPKPLPRLMARPARKTMMVVRTIAECRAVRAKLRRKRLALVPTMGALHEGHELLMHVAHENAPAVAVSIFVNPTQFGPREDFNRYPRPIEADLEKCRRGGVDLVFIPSVDEMYGPDAPEITVDLPQLTTVLEGKHRPGHFKGVCQVVAKLFNIITPNVAVFGQKDFQQLRIITAMTEALDWPIQIVPCTTLRDPDGLALSSRNQYLSPEERQKALSISRALQAAETEFKQGIRQTNRLTATMQRIMLEQHLNIDYAAAVDPISLKPVEVVNGRTVLAIAARVGNTRLIDNLILEG